MTPERRKLLADCAALARTLASEQCWRDAGSGAGCAWYHSFWPYLRLLDYGTSPELHSEFYVQGLAPLAVSATPVRVLVSGAADFAMLAVTRKALAAAPVAPRFTVADRCDTPLSLCRWYAAREGFALETKTIDLLDYEDAEGFDAIVTHGFLGSFPSDVRAQLAARWFTLLRRGARLLIINRIRDPQAAASIPFSTDEYAAFMARLTADLETHRDLLDAPPAEIAAMAEAYLKAKRSFPVRGSGELAALFEDAGFRLDQFGELAAADPGEARPSGPTMPGNATYMKVIARRPA